MASEVVREEKGTDSQEKRDDVVAIDLPAPDGWRKKFTPKKGGTPRRNEIVFISPTGEEIRNKRQLDQYLKSHPGDLSTSDFDWGTGDTPRRSARINEKSKATETPEPEPPKKVQKKSSLKKGPKEEGGKIDVEGENTEDKAATVAETEVIAAEVEKKDDEDVGSLNKGEVASEEALAVKDTVTEMKVDETDMGKLENPEASTEETCVAKEEDPGNKSLPVPGPEEENKEEAEKEQVEPKAPSQAQVPDETAKSEQEEKIVMDAASEVADSKESETVEVGQTEHLDKETAAEEATNVVAKPDVDSLKEDQDVGKTVENHSLSCGDAPHEPKASQVSC